jgi:hypothetical protein
MMVGIEATESHELKLSNPEPLLAAVELLTVEASSGTTSTKFQAPSESVELSSAE